MSDESIIRLSIDENMQKFCNQLLLLINGLQLGGLGSKAQYILSKQLQNTWISVNLGGGLSLAFAVYAGYHISGAHLNPAVSFAFFTMGRLSAIKLAVYCLAQICGAFVAAMLVYFTYFDSLNNYDGGERKTTGALATAGIFASYPQEYLSIGNGLFDQVC
ncbi:unnamed protein product [Anisakis simplex]|uniref:Aquaporin n=1 Tax=Anisakis simplex TaxID=6269 RepID=A0A0M3KCP2_ANISI|nr:unnamed protein product [Anisakis simplex]